jgi:hypothetical protein
MYFAAFLISASLATVPGPITARFRWLTARVSGQVKSQTKQRPFDHDMTVRPYGRLPSSPSSLESEDGSNNAGIFADTNARFIKSLTAL